MIIDDEDRIAQGPPPWLVWIPLVYVLATVGYLIVRICHR